jgi:hypothetical protein
VDEQVVSPPVGRIEHMFDTRVRSAAIAPDPSEVDDAELVEVIRAWERLASWAAAGQLAAIAEIARRRPRDLLDRPPGRTGPPAAGGPGAGADAGHPGLPEVSEFAVDEIAAALRLSRPAAGARLHTAVELTRLPATASALGAGVLDLPKVRAVVDAVGVLDDRTAGAVEARVLPRAAGQTVGQLRASLSRAVLSVDPAAAQVRHERAVADREVTVRPRPDGMAELSALLPADGAAAVYARLDRVARGVPAGDPRGMDARRADALVAAVLGLPATAGSVAGVGAPARPEVIATVHVTVPAATAVGLDDEPGELAGHGPVPASMARRLAGTGVWRKVTTDPVSGVVVGIDRGAYAPSAAVSDLVRARDRTCRFPGCRQPARRCDLDHVVPWPEGSTEPANLAALCRHHHRLKHQTQWTVQAGAGGLVRWTAPTGHRYVTSPSA